MQKEELKFGLNFAEKGGKVYVKNILKKWRER